MGLAIGIDFDGTLVEAGTPIRWRPYARDVLLALKRAGHKLVLHSARSTPPETGSPAARLDADAFWRSGRVPTDAELTWQRHEEMRRFLMREDVWGVFDLVWQQPGKPHCDIMIDDRMIAPDWVEVFKAFGVPLA